MTIIFIDIWRGMAWCANEMTKMICQRLNYIDVGRIVNGNDGKPLE